MLPDRKRELNSMLFTEENEVETVYKKQEGLNSYKPTGLRQRLKVSIYLETNVPFWESEQMR